MGCHTTLTNNSRKCPGQKHHNVTEFWKQEGRDGIRCCHIHSLGIHKLSLFLYDKYSQLRTHIMK